MHILANPRICGKNQKIKFGPLMYSACMTLMKFPSSFLSLVSPAATLKKPSYFCNDGNQWRRQGTRIIALSLAMYLLAKFLENVLL